MRKLYEIDSDIENFEFDIDLDTGEILNADDLDALQMERDRKIEGVGLKVKNLEAEKEAVKREKDNFAEREKRLAKDIEGYKNWMTRALKNKPFKTDRLVVSYRSSKSVDITDEALIPDEYCNFTVEKKPDKTAIRKALEADKEVKGATLVEKQNIQIK